MSNALQTAPTRGRGRPRTNTEAVTVRLDGNALAVIDRLRNARKKPVSRPEAIRKMIQSCLKGVS